MEDKIKAVAEYCRQRIDGWEHKVALALDAMGRRDRIDPDFAHEVENYAVEWAEDNGYAVDFFDGIDVVEIIFNSDERG